MRIKKDYYSLLNKIKNLTFLFFIGIFLVSCGSSNDSSINTDSTISSTSNTSDPIIKNCSYCIPKGAAFSCEEIVKSMKLLNDTIRAEVGIPSLEWDCEVAKEAQKWAEYLAENGLFIHSNDHYGENIYIATNSLATLPHAIQSFYDEKLYFQYGLPEWCNGGECRHYTQLIWKNTKKIGCGKAKYKNKYEGVFDYVIVCKFSPAGNIIGEQPY